MNYYTLWYSNECGSECEHEFEAIDDDAAVVYAQKYCSGNEGLWTGIYLMGDSNCIDFTPF